MRGSRIGDRGRVAGDEISGASGGFELAPADIGAFWAADRVKSGEFRWRFGRV